MAPWGVNCRHPPLLFTRVIIGPLVCQWPQADQGDSAEHRHFQAEDATVSYATDVLGRPKRVRLGSARSLPLPIAPRGLLEAGGSHRVSGRFHEVIGLPLDDVEGVERSLTLLGIGVLGPANLHAEWEPVRRRK